MTDLAQRLLADPNKREVLAWLREGAGEERGLGVLPTAEESISFAREIYEAGAEEVIAVDIEHYKREYVDGDIDRESTRKLVVVLPADPQRRKRVLRWEAKHARSIGLDPTKDEGQRYLFVLLD
jgi:hypothetical protein